MQHTPESHPLRSQSRDADEQALQGPRVIMPLSAPDISLPTHQQPAAHQSPFFKLPEQLRCLESLQIDPNSSKLSNSTRILLVLYALLLLGIIYHTTTSSSSSSWPTALHMPQSKTEEHCNSDGLHGSSASSRNSRSSSNASPSPGATAAAGTVTTSAAAAAATAGAAGATCPFGSLPGTWISTAAAGAKWQTLDPDCQLHNWLEVYAAAGHGSSSSGSSDAQAAPPTVRILLLSDSVDRFIVQHVCDFIGGDKQTHVMHPNAAAEEAEAAAEQLRQQQQQQQQRSGESSVPSLAGQSPAAAAAAGGGPPHGGGSPLNKTAYAFHECGSIAPLKLASSYFPGVHPTGPFHRYSAQNFKQRIDSAREMWTEYAGPGNEPHLVSVASLLWDVARIYMHEREQMEGQQYLDRNVLDGWLQNFTQVVAYAQEKFPQTPLWVTHTTMPPHHNPTTGIMTKPYLGRRYFIHQLNAAAATAARRLGMQLVDYEALSEPFLEGQKHLVDLIHPNAVVGVEAFNMMLNLVIQQQQQQQSEQQQRSGQQKEVAG